MFPGSRLLSLFPKKQHAFLQWSVGRCDASTKNNQSGWVYLYARYYWVCTHTIHLRNIGNASNTMWTNRQTSGLEKNNVTTTQKHVQHFSQVENISHTVDGKNPAPVDVVDIPLFTSFYTSQVVVWDFFHQQYILSTFSGKFGSQLQSPRFFRKNKLQLEALMAYPATHFSLCMFQIPEKHLGLLKTLRAGWVNVILGRSFKDFILGRCFFLAQRDVIQTLLNLWLTWGPHRIFVYLCFYSKTRRFVWRVVSNTLTTLGGWILKSKRNPPVETTCNLSGKRREILSKLKWWIYLQHQQYQQK